MATIQNMVVRLGMNPENLMKGLKRSRRQIQRFQFQVNKTTKSIRGMSDAAANMAKPAGLMSVAASGIAVTKAVAPASKALLALPGAASVGAGAITTVQTATSGLGDAMEALASGDAQDIADAMENLSPAAESAARAMHGLSEGFDPVRSAVQESVFADLSGRIDELGSTYLPVLETGMDKTGSAINGLAKEALDAVNTPFFSGVVSDVFDTTADSLKAFTPAVKPMTKALGNLVKAGLPLIQSFSEWAAESLKAKAAFLGTEEGLSFLQAKLRQGVTAFKQLISIVGNVKSALSGVFNAISADSESILGTVDRLSERFAEWANSAEGQSQMTKLFDQLFQFGKALVEILPMITGALMKLVEWFNQLPGPVKQAVGSFLAWSLLLGPLVSKLAPVISAVVKLNGKMLKSLATPGKWGNKMAKGFGKAGKAAGKAVARTTWAVLKITAKLAFMAAAAMARAITMAASWFIAMGPIGWIIGAVVGLVALIIANWDKVKKYTVKAFNATVDFVVRAFNWIVDAVSNGVSSAVDWVRGLPDKILGAIGNLGSLLWDAGQSIMQGLLDGIEAAWSWVQDKLSWITDKIPDWKGPIEVDAKLLQPAGEAIMGGLQAGIDGKEKDLKRKLQGVTRNIGNAVRPESALAETSGGNGGVTPENLREAMAGLSFTLDDQSGRVMAKVVNRVNTGNRRR